MRASAASDWCWSVERVCFLAVRCTGLILPRWAHDSCSVQDPLEARSRGLGWLGLGLLRHARNVCTSAAGILKVLQGPRFANGLHQFGGRTVH